MRDGNRKLTSILFAFFLVWLGVKFFLPLFSPFLLGLLLAVGAEPLVGLLHKKIGLPRGLSAGIGVCMAFALLAMGVLVICAALVRELGALAGILPDLEATAASGITLAKEWMLELADHSPQSLQPLLRSNVGALFSDGASLVSRITGYLLGLAGNLISHIPDSALGLGTAVISGCMISAKLPRLRRWLLRRIPREKLKILAGAWKRVKVTAAGWLLAQCKLMGVTFCLLAAGFWLLRIPYALVWAVGVCLVDALPVLGTGAVLIPWAVISFLQENGARAVGLLGIYVTVALVRSTLEPKLLGRHLGLDPLVTLMALYVGYQLWGIGGMLFAPLLTVVALQLAGNGRHSRSWEAE